MNDIKSGVAGWEDVLNAYLAGYDAALHPKKFYKLVPDGQ